MVTWVKEESHSEDEEGEMDSKRIREEKDTGRGD